jgi:nitric oxide reductase NorD protein
LSDRRLFEHELAEHLDRVLFASPSHRSIERLAQTLECLPRPRQDKVLHWAAVAARTYAEIGYLLATLAPDAFARLGDDGFDAWVIAGLDSYDREGLRPAMDRLRDIGGFAAAREGERAVRLAEVEPRLTRFVRGLSGRPLTLRAGDHAWTDTDSLTLPAVLVDAASAAENARRYKAMAAMLWAQTWYGTYSVDIEAEIAGVGDPARALQWLAVLEAIRLDARIAADLPGLGADIAAARGPWPASLARVLPRLGHADASVADSLALLPEILAADEPPPPMPLAGVLNPAIARRVRAERIEREKKVLRQALAALKAAGGRKPAGEPELNVMAADDGALEVRVDGDLVKLPPEVLAAAQSLVQDLGELPPEVLTPAGPGAWLPTDRQESGADLAGDRNPDWRYDEWDYHRGSYRKNWCHVFEMDVVAGDADYVDEVGARRRSLITQIRRRFEAVRGEDRMLGRQAEGDEIDLDAQVDAHIDRTNGVEPSPRLFSRRIRSERSMAAMFMVDMSGSTKGWVNDAEREALIMLCEALEALGDDYAIYGFSGWTRTRCDIYRIKAFADRYDAGVRGRIAGIEAKDYTRMGVAIRHLVRLLAARPVRHKLLVTLSDGRPDDFGDEYRGSYGIEDTRQAYQEARRQGIHSYCVTIDRHGADYLKRMVGPAAYTVLADVGRLPVKIADIYRRLTVR